MAILEAKNITQRQGALDTQTLLFSDVNLRWEAPSTQVIMGLSGSGKSSLLKTLGGVWKPRSGELLFNTERLWSRKNEVQNPEILKNLGFAFQNNALFNSMRVLENLSYPHRQRFPEQSEQSRQSLAQEWLEKVELGHTAKLFPHELSGGMQKRLAIARTLMLQPAFLFLDDPTAGLDPITSKNLSDLLKGLLKGSHSLVVIVTNDTTRALSWNAQIHFLHTKQLVSPGNPAYSKIRDVYL